MKNGSHMASNNTPSASLYARDSAQHFINIDSLNV